MRVRCYPANDEALGAWGHLPRVFDWTADRGHAPCAFGAVYQLARNAFAAVVMPRAVTSTRPAATYSWCMTFVTVRCRLGTADRQWEAAAAACLFPGLLRRLSWQRLLGHIAEAETQRLGSLQTAYTASPCSSNVLRCY